MDADPTVVTIQAADYTQYLLGAVPVYLSLLWSPCVVWPTPGVHGQVYRQLQWGNVPLR